MKRYTDKYGNERVKLDSADIAALKAADNGSNDFVHKMRILAERLGYLSVKQYEAVSRYL